MTIDHSKIEEKWTERWAASHFHQPDLTRSERPFYNLMMFPYPSAEGLHVGNMFAFVGSDVQGRYKRACGYDVLEPMGFDAFGMHSENHAIKTSRHPWEMVPENIEFFRERQLKRIGNMFDWRCQVSTTEAQYYQWTQWIFVQLLKAGLAYQKTAPVNWCPSCRTVLANEQAEGGTCERCDSVVETRHMKQWFFRITDYAERLLKNLDWIDWSETTKQTQKNWIGKSTGAEISFTIEGSSQTVTVFTTRPDTVFGATFIALAPDHPIAAAYLSHTGTAVDADWAGIDTECVALNPVNQQRLPVWIANYVVSDYGSGAIMGVPAHDTRDHEFAVSHGIESGAFTELESDVAAERIIDLLESKGWGKAKVAYRLRDWCISRQRYWGTPIPVIHCATCGAVPVPEDNLPVVLPYIEDFQPDGSGESPLARSDSYVHVDCPSCGRPARRETDVCDNFLDSAWYFLRYPSHSNKEAAFSPEATAKWLPVDLYIGGNEHAALHLMYTRFVTMALHDLGYLPFEEPFRKFRAHGLIIKDGSKMSKSRGNIVNPDTYIDTYGADVFRTYLMFFGNYQEGGDFRDGNIVGIRRFLERVYTFCSEGDFDNSVEMAPRLCSQVHTKMRKVTTDIERLQYNTAIAAIMELFALFSGSIPSRCPVEAVSILLRLLAPFAPFVTHELWHTIGFTDNIAAAPWPDYDEKLIMEDSVEFVVQINGRMRDRFPADPAITESEARRIAFSRERIRVHTEGRNVVRVVFVPRRLLNIVID
jgi:leucyl-tRNA synthetase